MKIVSFHPIKISTQFPQLFRNSSPLSTPETQTSTLSQRKGRAPPSRCHQAGGGGSTTTTMTTCTWLHEADSTYSSARPKNVQQGHLAASRLLLHYIINAWVPLEGQCMRSIWCFGLGKWGSVWCCPRWRQRQWWQSDSTVRFASAKAARPKKIFKVLCCSF